MRCFLLFLFVVAPLFCGKLQGNIGFQYGHGPAQLFGDNEIASAADAKISDDMARLNFFRAELGEIIMSELRVEGTNEIDPHAVGYVSGRITFELATIAVTFVKIEKLNAILKLQEIGDRLPPGVSPTLMTNISRRIAGFVNGLRKTKMCFVAGTLVVSKIGAHEQLLPIEQLETAAAREAGGLEVWARDEFTGEEGWKRPLAYFTTYPSELVHLAYDVDHDGQADETLTGTPQHPFWVNGRSAFVPMGELEAGEVLHLENGGAATITSASRERAPPGETFTTYNFEVEDFHTYFVGESGVWVHNSGAFNCEELFSFWYRHLDDFDGDHWRAFRGLMDDPPPAWAEVWPERWRLRGLNEVRLDWITNPNRGGTPPPWRNAAVNNPGAVKSAPELGKNINAAFGFVEKPEGFTAHHIVMTVDSPSRPNMTPLSVEAREILARNGNIDINDAANGTYLPHTGAKNADFADNVYGPRHQVAGEPNFHNLDYLTAVVEELRTVDGLGRDAVTDKLQEIAARIIERDFPGIPQL